MQIAYRLEKFKLPKDAHIKSEKALHRAFLAALIDGQGYTAEEHLSAPGRAPDPAWPISQHRLRTDTGMLRKSWLSVLPKISKHGSSLTGKLGTDRPDYIKFHEKSGQRQPLTYGMKNARDLMANTLERIYTREIKDLK